jgi:DNA-binding LytR/AlgR family response regulator
MKLRCIILDDEPLARQGMEEYVKEVPFLHHQASFESAVTAASFLADHPVDLILLDIRMPKLTGIEFLRGLKEPPLIIFVTAYPEYALESYELDVVDYLVKPVSLSRFQKAVQKALEVFSWRQPGKPYEHADHFFLKCDHKFEKIQYRDIMFIEAMQNYCIVHMPGKKLISYITLAAMLDKLPFAQFLKVHKSYIVSLEKITAIDGNDIMIQSNAIPIGRSFKDEVMQKVIGKNLLKR